MLKKDTTIIILAAGKGSRMKSNFPKVLHKLGDKTILEHVINTAKSINPKKIILVDNFEKKIISSNIQEKSINYVIQKKQNGTGGAILAASKEFLDDEYIIVLYGDMPFISVESVKQLIKYKKKSKITLLTSYLDNPNGYGRVLRKNKKIISIIEEKNANCYEKKIKEVYSGTFIANAKNLKKWLKKINDKNIQKELYATDIVHIAYLEGANIKSVKTIKTKEILGINNKLQLSILEEILQKEKIKKLLINGITLKNPYNFTIRGNLKHGKNVEIESGVVLEGNIFLGDNIKIGTGCIIKNSFINDNTHIKEYTILDNVQIGKNCIIGPFAHLRPETILSDEVEIGNFVEIKDSNIKKLSKIKHLSYIGNAEIGARVNIGAGSITCNYDGKNKFKTTIGDNVFIGSNTQLVAPIKIINNTTIAAGTTLTKNINIPCLVYNKKIQKCKINWTKSNKNKKSTD